MFEKEPQFFREREASEKISKQEEELKLAPEEKELVLDVINHPVVQRGLERYKIFSEYYFGDKLEKLTEKELKKYEVEKLPSKEDIKQRADEIFSEDDIYPGILKLGEESGKPVENKDFINIAAGKLGKEGLDELKKAKEEGKLNEAMVNMNIEETKRILEKEGAEEKLRRVGKMIVGIDKEHPEVLRPHLPRIAGTLGEVNKAKEESYKILAEELQTDKQFKDIKKLDAISWLIGEGVIKKGVWHSYSEEEMKKFEEENPEAYKDAQKTGVIASPRLFRKYLLGGKMPKIGGQWITKEEFIEKMESVESTNP